jgi:hypothetical protein
VIDVDILGGTASPSGDAAGLTSTIKQKGHLPDEHMYPDVSKDLAQKRRELAPEIYNALAFWPTRLCRWRAAVED